MRKEKILEHLWDGFLGFEGIKGSDASTLDAPNNNLLNRGSGSSLMR